MSESSSSSNPIPSTESLPPTSTEPPPASSSSVSDSEPPPSSSSSSDESSSSSVSSTPEPSTPTSSSAPDEPSLTSDPPTTSPSTSVTIVTSGASQVTRTLVLTPTVVSPTASQTDIAADSGNGGSFFDNTGAVAGTFAAVGVVALVGILFLVRMYLRKRKRERFDREVDEAAFQAASVPPPAFLDDDGDDGDYRPGRYPGSKDSGPGGGGTYYGASDASSLGTYSHQPMTHAESYGMSELGNIGRVQSVGPGQIFNHPTSGAAGIGVQRTRSFMGNAATDFQNESQQQQQQQQQSPQPGYGLEAGNTPYAAFAYPHRPPSHPPAPSGYNMDNPYAAAMNSYPNYSHPTLPHRATSMTSSHAATGAYDNGDSAISPMTNPHDYPPPQQAPLPLGSAAEKSQAADFGGSTPEYAHAPIHQPQQGEWGNRWSDYEAKGSDDEDDGGYADRSRVQKSAAIQEDDEEEEERPKVFKVANA